MTKNTLSFFTLICFSTALFAFDVPYHQPNQKQHAIHTAQNTQSTPHKKTALTEAGNTIFGTIQEVINQLNANPNTDWSKVNIEALRQHLLDMEDMATGVDVISQTAIKNGVRLVVVPNRPRASISLAKVFKDHPPQLKRETGWTMTSKKQNGQYILSITGDMKDTQKIRALGYIGLMAYGNHHQPHHLSISTGSNPHQH